MYVGRNDEAIGRLRPGDVIRVPGGRGGPGVVLSSSRRRGTPQLRVVTSGKNRHTLGPADFREPPARLARIDLPSPYAPNSPAYQKLVATSLRGLRLADDGDERDTDPALAGLERAVAEHPVSRCPDLPRHRRAVVQLERAERERADLGRQVQGRSASLSRQFDRVLQVLERWGHLDGWALTPAGERLARIYHETDLLIAQSLEEGLFDGLDRASLAGLVSVFTHERRGPGEGPVPWFPSGDVRARWAKVEALAGRLNDHEVAAGLPPTRPLDPGFVALAHAWAAGEELDDVLEDEELSGGDFVRNVKQLIDLLRQLGDVAPVPATARAARAAADALFRGVVSASSTLAVADDADPEG